MRFVSQYPNYGVQVRPQRVEPLGDGTSRVVQKPLYIKFTAVDAGGMLYEKEHLLASSLFKFHGSRQYQDEATPVETIHRFSVLDTIEDAEKNQWSADDVAEIEAVLMRKAETTPNAVMVMEQSPLAPPFPAYDDWTQDGETLVLKLTEDGYNLAEVLAYERSNFGPRRPEILEALDIGITALEEYRVSA